MQKMARLPTLMLVTASLIQQVKSAEGTIPTYPADTGVHCFECPPGTYVSEDCSEDLTNSTCETCPRHFYSDQSNRQAHCQACKSNCPKNSVVVKNCTPSTNLECICHEGYHMFPLDHFDPHWICHFHSECKNNQGEKYYGNHTHNTACEDCGENQFVDRSDPAHPLCQNCRICDPGFPEVRNCSLDSDTICADTNGSIYHVENSTQSPLAPESDSLNAGEIAAIVTVCIVLAVIVVIITCLWRRWKKHRQMKKQKEKDAEAALQNGTVGLVAVYGQQHSGGDNQADTQKESDREESAIPLLNSSSGEPVARGSEKSFTSDWDVEFITGEVFHVLSRSLGSEWKSFVMQLAGWPSPQMAWVTTENKTDENRTVPDRIHACLWEWRKMCRQEFVTKANILAALTQAGRNDLKQELEQEATSGAEC